MLIRNIKLIQTSASEHAHSLRQIEMGVSETIESPDLI